jgi:hypothetical protein
MMVEPSVDLDQVLLNGVISFLQRLDQSVVFLPHRQHLALERHTKCIVYQEERLLGVQHLQVHPTGVILRFLHLALQTLILQANQCYPTSGMHRSTHRFLFRL